MLLSHRTSLLKDHQALVHYHRIKFWNRRLYWWCLELQDLPLEIRYIPGTTKVVADALLRILKHSLPRVITFNQFSVIPCDLIFINLKD